MRRKRRTLAERCDLAQAKIKESNEVVWLQDVAGEELTEGSFGSIGYLSAGDVGHVAMVHGDGEDLEVEFLTLTGMMGALATLRAGQIRAASETRPCSSIRKRDPS
jgi:hypothetical protein